MMSMLMISVGLLFAVGFGAGYLSRMLLSIVRRNKQRKLRAVREMGQTAKPAIPVAAKMDLPQSASASRVANA